jgi:N-acyl-D-amino-acid deacylase
MAMSEEDVKRIMQYPFQYVCLGCRHQGIRPGSASSKKLWNQCKDFRQNVREENVLTLEEAIRRMTALPAQKFQLKDRGILKEGFAADIVVFDEKEVTDLSTFEQPHHYSKGFMYVLVNAKIVIDAAKHTGIRSGHTLMGPGKVGAN